MKTYIGIDNGTSGSIGVLIPEQEALVYWPATKQEQNYVKKKDTITRIDFPRLRSDLRQIVEMSKGGILAILERPLVNPGQFKTTGRALRSLEATLIALEEERIPYQYCDSRQWQKVLLPEGIKGSPNLKRASMDIGIRFFPHLEKEIKKQKDADGLLIAEWAKRAGL